MYCDLNLEKLVHSKNVEMFSRVLYQSITGYRLPASDEDYQKPSQKVHLFTLEKDGKVWDETEYGDMDQLAALSVSVDEMDDCDEDNYERKEFTFDFETGTYCADFSGEWFDAEDGDSGSIWIDTGQLREEGSYAGHFKSWKEDNENYWKNVEASSAKLRKKYENSCVIVKSISEFKGKTFVATGFEDTSELKTFLTAKGAFLRQAISGKTDYLIVIPEGAGETKFKAVLQQAVKGHTVEVIFFEDFAQYLP